MQKLFIALIVFFLNPITSWSEPHVQQCSLGQQIVYQSETSSEQESASEEEEDDDEEPECD